MIVLFFASLVSFIVGSFISKFILVPIWIWFPVLWVLFTYLINLFLIFFNAKLFKKKEITNTDDDTEAKILEDIYELRRDSHKDAWDTNDGADGINGYKKFRYYSNRPDFNEGAKADASITYEDIKNNTTKREITVNQVDRDYLSDGREYWVHAYCHFRKQNRDFRLSRIRELIDLDSGEIIDNNKYELFFNNLYEKSPGFTSELLIDKYTNELMILNYIADLDDRFTSKEKELIFNFINEKTNNAITDEEKLFINEQIGKGASTQPKAKKAVSKIKALNNYDKEILIKAINEMLGLSKKINPVVEAGAKMIIGALNK